MGQRGMAPNSGGFQSQALHGTGIDTDQLGWLKRGSMYVKMPVPWVVCGKHHLQMVVFDFHDDFRECSR